MEVQVSLRPNRRSKPSSPSSSSNLKRKPKNPNPPPHALVASSAPAPPLPTVRPQRQAKTTARGGTGEGDGVRRGPEAAVLGAAHGVADAARPRVQGEGGRHRPVLEKFPRALRRPRQPRRPHHPWSQDGRPRRPGQRLLPGRVQVRPGRGQGLRREDEAGERHQRHPRPAEGAKRPGTGRGPAEQEAPPRGLPGRGAPCEHYGAPSRSQARGPVRREEGGAAGEIHRQRNPAP